MVLATQNPIEQEGTYVLPEAQMDRFLLKEVLDYPRPGTSWRCSTGTRTARWGCTPARSAASCRRRTSSPCSDMVQRVYVDPAVKDYIVRIVHATRHIGERSAPSSGSYVEFGASPRGTIAFFQVARALAFLDGRNHVVPEDVHALRHGVLRHRIHLTFEAVADRVRPEEIVDAVFSAVSVP